MAEREEGAVPAEVRAEVHADCMQAFAEDRAELSAARYDALVTCVLATRTLAEIAGCTPG